MSSGTGAMMPCFGPAIRSHSADGVAACPIVDHGQLGDSRHRSDVWHMAVSLLLCSKGRLRQSPAPLHWELKGGGGGQLTAVNSRTKDASECKRRAPCAAVTGWQDPDSADTETRRCALSATLPTKVGQLNRGQLTAGRDLHTAARVDRYFMSADGLLPASGGFAEDASRPDKPEAALSRPGSTIRVS